MKNKGKVKFFVNDLLIGEADAHGDIIMPGSFGKMPESPFILKRDYSKEETKAILDKVLNQPIAWSIGMDYDNPTRAIEEEIKPLKK